MNITVVGAGYVGLSLGTLLATQHHVTVLDIIQEKVDKINSRISPIKDDYIERYFREKVLDLTATVDAETAYCSADFVIIATPTDYNPETKVLNVSSVDSAVGMCLRYNTECVIVIKSTVPIGYTRGLCQKYTTDRIMFSPEFLRETMALYDSLYPSRIVVGTNQNNQQMVIHAQVFAQMLSQCSLKDDVPILIIGLDEAEASKLFSNTYLAMRVAFFNELDGFTCEYGMNSRSVIDVVSLDPRIGKDYNNPSFGYGGSCLPKDTKQLKACYDGFAENLISAICDANDTRKQWVVDKILDLNCKTVGIYRLIMKSGADNFRSSAVWDIMQMLKQAGKDIIVYEPLIGMEAKECFGFTVVNSFDLFAEKSDLIIANRVENQLFPVMNKVYTRDVFWRD